MGLAVPSGWRQVPRAAAGQRSRARGREQQELCQPRKPRRAARPSTCLLSTCRGLGLGRFLLLASVFRADLKWCVQCHLEFSRKFQQRKGKEQRAWVGLGEGHVLHGHRPAQSPGTCAQALPAPALLKVLIILSLNLCFVTADGWDMEVAVSGLGWRPHSMFLR